MTHNINHRPRTPDDLKTQYQRAFALCSQNPPDLLTARRLLLQCVLQDPGNLIFVETFLYVLRRVGAQQGWWRGFWHRVAFEQAIRRGDWPRLVQSGLKLLALRPDDPLVLCGLGDAHIELDHNDVALLYWKMADAQHPENVTVQQRCARALARLGLFEHAQVCRQRAGQLGPEHRCHAHHRAGKASPPPAITDRPDRAAVQCDPSNVQGVLQHVIALRDDGYLQEAIELLRRALQANPGDIRLSERLEDVELELAQLRIEMGRQQASTDPSPRTEQLVEDLRADLHRREIEVYAARSSRYPDDPAWKLRLAQSLKRVGSFEQACRTLQEIPPHSARQCEVSIELGECLQYRREFASALAAYEQAANLCPDTPPLSDTQKLSLYRAGVLSLQLGHDSKAARYLERLSAESPDYKDLARHLDKIASIRHKDGFSSELLPPQQSEPGSGSGPANRSH